MRKKLKKLHLVKETVKDLTKAGGAGYTDPGSGCETLVGGGNCADIITGKCAGQCTSRTSCDSDACQIQ